MGTHSTSAAARLAAVFTGLGLLAAVPVGLAADGSPAQEGEAGLRAEAGSLENRLDAATLELYSLEAQLGRTRAELDALDARRASLRRERASARAQLQAAKAAVRASQTQLGELVRALYERPGSDPLAVVLGAGSVDEALAGLDGLSRAAGQSTRIVEQARVARKRLARLDARLAARSTELLRLATKAKSRANALAAQAAERRRFISGLRQRLGVNAARIASIQSEARAAEVRTAAIAATAPAAEAAPVEVAAPLVASPSSGLRTLTVTSSGYALRGRTATGIPTGPGVVAVDPSVIPLGTRMEIPGFGIGIAADTGGAIQGHTIDLWFPTAAQALQWGRRTVTITLLQ